MVSGKITERAMLARLSITQWTARKLDKRITSEVLAEHQAKADAGRWNKSLIASDALKELQQAATAGRELHYTYTLPWRDDGARILPARAFLEYSQKMRDAEAAFRAAVRSFCENYPAYVDDARARLNGMFCEADYPGVDRIRSRFTWRVAIDPMPDADDFRVALSDDALDAIRQDIDGRTREALAVGMRDAWTRLHSVVSAMADRLSDPDAIFRDSLVGNLRDACQILPLLNFADDAHLERMRQAVETTLAGFNPDELRANKPLRADVARRASALASDMSAFMGAGAEVQP